MKQILLFANKWNKKTFHRCRIGCGQKQKHRRRPSRRTALQVFLNDKASFTASLRAFWTGKSTRQPL
ncbi:hypothetical protein [Raoultella terrigena]|uniref:hypothetical protein n=1 Tax=Raoultella terrigena TaxID=577 RepID=UPI001F2ACA0B|nr:hypothetical protein [Raoultella terrigena]MCE9899256.1 hypothetical protein [Raoultella terrigena]